MANGDHIALISGANRGIGAEVARQLAAKGMAIVIGARDPESAKETVEAVQGESGEATVVPLDVTSPASIASAVKTICTTYGELHVLINNAGIDYDADQDATSADLERVRKILNTNLFGAWALTQAAIPLMRATCGPRAIVNVSSDAGQLATMGRNSPGYSVSKTALNAFTRILAAELDDDGIRVNAVDPGWVATDMGGDGGRSVRDGAASVVWAATLDRDGPTGGFFHDGKDTAW
ncbi:MAG: SDR family NAD(P)-dependent oxidoreductase [Pseudomonadota bacterium]